MKRLRNLGIYYILIGIALTVSFVFFQLWRIAIIGVLFISTYFILKYIFKVRLIPSQFNQNHLRYLDWFYVVSPFLIIFITLWFLNRPYRQNIILPEDYEGVVAVQYNQENGQDKKWAGGFWGIGGHRIIDVDSTGMAKTQFKFMNNTIPFFGINHNDFNVKGLKIVYESNLEKEIVKNANGYSDNTYINTDPTKPSIYFTAYNRYPLIIFVITKESNYLKYFKNKLELTEMEEKYKKDPYNHYPPEG